MSRIRYEELKEGILLKSTRNFGCVQPEREFKVLWCKLLQAYYVPCIMGKHFLDMNEDSEGFISGFEKHE